MGAGGAGFPAHVKYAAKAEVFIINAAECEPLIETDKFLMRSFAEQMITAAAVVARHLGARRTVVALKRKYTAEIAALRAAIAKTGENVELFEMDTFYPAGDEQTMVSLVTGRSVPERGLPLDVGAVVSNVGTLVNVEAALRCGEAVTYKYLSVVGEVREPVMLRVPIGTAIEECIAAARPKLSEYAIILGGPMMGRPVARREDIAREVVTKTTGNIIVLPPEHYLILRSQQSIQRIKQQTRAACIQCRMCTDLCPRYLIGHAMRPHLVMRNLYREASIKDNGEYMRAFGDAANCCSCGVCEMFACPMGLSPRKVNDYMKKQLREHGVDVPRGKDPQAMPDAVLHHTPTGRLAARLALAPYYGLHAHECIELTPESVFIPFSQHIGKPAVPVKAAGDTVHVGDLLAAAAEGALSANIHASIHGTITEITAAGARLVRRKEA